MLDTQLPPVRLPISKMHDPYKIEGVDMRSGAGRRFRDLVDLVYAEHGLDVDPVKVRELAGLRLAIEITQAALVNSDRLSAELTSMLVQVEAPRRGGIGS